MRLQNNRVSAGICPGMDYLVATERERTHAGTTVLSRTTHPTFKATNEDREKNHDYVQENSVSR